MLVRKDLPYVVMGLLDSGSLACAIGETIVAHGGKVIYTVQNKRIRSIFFDRDRELTDEDRARMDIRYCDVTRENEVEALFAATGPVAGVVHSIAYANPKTCLGEEFHSATTADILQGFNVSCASLAMVASRAHLHMPAGGALLALTFDTTRAYPFYNWMGVNKAAMESLVRALARRHGRDLIRVNAVSAGPLYSKSASRIPGFGKLDHMWNASSPLPWDPQTDRQSVAQAAAFLMGPFSKKITGQILFVDGGASIIAGELMPFERVDGPAAKQGQDGGS